MVAPTIFVCAPPAWHALVAALETIMNVIACISRVPDTASRISVGADGKSPSSEGLSFVINPYDEFALEAAIQLKEKTGGNLVVVHVGPADFQKDLRQCLAKGADKAIMITTEGDLGPHGIAALIQEHCAEHLPATVFCGKQAVDGDVGATGIMLAGKLDLPYVSKVSGLEIDGENATATREIEGAVEEISFSLPAVITCDKGLNEPRRAGLKDIMAAKKKPLDVVKVSAPEAKLNVQSFELPPERAEGRIVGEGADAVPALVEALKNEAKVL